MQANQKQAHGVTSPLLTVGRVTPNRRYTHCMKIKYKRPERQGSGLCYMVRQCLCGAESQNLPLAVAMSC